MNNVFVLDTGKKPLSMCRPARARQLLKEGKAAVYRKYPFTIILKVAMPEAVVKEVIVKLDPGSKTTGIALVSDNRVVFAAELEHRGQYIKNRIVRRAALRRNRRSRKTRYRAARFNNRCRKAGWLPPSLQHRVLTTMTWVNKFRKFASVSELAIERVKFDMQKMVNPEISGIEYQQGTLQGYEVREYLLEKFNRTCVYCDAKDVPLQIEHIHAKSKGGSNKISNLTLACEACNKKKDNLDINVFLKNKPELLKNILKKVKTPLKDAAAVNATRNALFKALLDTGLPVETGTGSQTKYNRTNLKLPKEHWIDAACVGDSGSEVKVDATFKPLKIKSMGHGNRQMCITNKHGFPIKHRTRKKVHFGFQTGDIARVVVFKGVNTGIHVGRVICNIKGNFSVRTTARIYETISYKKFILLQKNDGYSYN